MRVDSGKYSIMTITVGLLLASSTAFAAPAPSCDTFQFSGATRQSAPNTPFVGTMTMINLQSGESSSASVETMLLGYVDSAGGHVVTSHEISDDSNPGVNLVTFDDAQLIPQGGGVFTLISQLKVKTGKGAYTCGEMVIGSDPFEPANNSTVSFDQQGVGTAEYSGFGRLCRCKPADN